MQPSCPFRQPGSFPLSAFLAEVVTHMKNKSIGYFYVLLAITIFAIQDGCSKYLADKYPVIGFTMIRFWAFAAFVIVFAAFSPGGLRKAFVSRRPFLQMLRGPLLVLEIFIVVYAYTGAGLAMTQAILQATPLIITILSVPLLGEKVGWRRGTAIVVGLFGVLIILNPVGVRFDLQLLWPLAGALAFGLYGISTRAVGREDSAVTSVLYTGVFGAIVATAIGPFYWVPIAPEHWPALFALCVCGATSHFFLIKAYSTLTAVEVQPLTYLQIVLSVAVATTFFGETITINMIVGAIIVVAAGLFTVFREHRLGIK
ncbi:EamA-like transporter family protein [compost metagenome]